jgi:hypothetical protein
VQKLAFAIAALCAFSAQAGDNDLELWRLGHPDDLPCTRCDGSAGDVKEPGSVDAQARYHRFASTLGLAFVPPFQEPAATTGQAGFEIGFSVSEAYVNIEADAWPTAATQAKGPVPQVLLLPTLALRKGFGGSFEVGAAISYLTNSQMVGLSAELRWALLEGIAYAPDLALRGWATRVVGSRELDLTVGGADVSISKSFGVLGMMKLQPYGQAGVAWVSALSGVVNFKPQVALSSNPTAQDGVFRDVNFFDNRFSRAAVGLRLVAGAVVLAVEGSVAAGTNAIQSNDLPQSQCSPGSCKPPSETVRLWSSAARLGFAF